MSSDKRSGPTESDNDPDPSIVTYDPDWYTPYIWTDCELAMDKADEE